jgi:uncharacterized SAM-binding protein YcdF (DUF218 family)
VSRRLLAVVMAAATAALAFVETGNVLALSAPISKPDAIVVLGSHEWERLPTAGRLARANPRAVVLLTSPVWATQKNCYQCENRVEWLVRAGVKRKQIVVLDHKVRNTHDEAAATFSYAATRGTRSLLVVTSPYHGRRALATFRAVFKGTPVRVGVETTLYASGARPQRWWMGAYDRWYVAYESAAIVMYAVRYGVNPFVG